MPGDYTPQMPEADRLFRCTLAGDIRRHVEFV